MRTLIAIADLRFIWQGNSAVPDSGQMSQDLSRRQVRVVVDGLDVSPALLDWGLGREALSFDAAASVNGTIVLAGILGESLDPKINPRWNPGSVIILRIANDLGVLVDPPFGGQLRIISSTYSSGKTPIDGSLRPEQLTLEVGCDLAYSREPEKPFEMPGNSNLGVPLFVSTVVDRFLGTKNLRLSPEPGDPAPGNVINYGPTYSGRGSLVDWCHQRIWCQPEGSYGLWQDSQGQIRFFSVSTSAAYWRVFDDQDLPGRVPISDQREQLPGKIRGNSNALSVSSRPTSSRYTSIAKDTSGTLIGYDIVSWDLSQSRERTTTKKYRRKGAALKGAEPDDGSIFLAESTTSVRNFGAYGRMDREEVSVLLPRGNIDPDSEGETSLILGQEDTTINRFGYGVVVERRQESRKARGLLGLEGSPTTLETEQIFLESWDKVGADEWRYYPRTIYNADIQRANQYTGAVPGGGGPGSRPPGADIRPDSFDTREVQWSAESSVAYSPQTTLGQPNVYGNGTWQGTGTFTGVGAFASTLDLLNWNGQGSQPSGISWQGSGSYTGTGFLGVLEPLQVLELLPEFRGPLAH